jgi:hypothetical protein
MEYSINCISPLYSRYLSEEVQQSILAGALTSSQVEIAIADASASPFEVSVGFVDSTTLPSADVQVSLSVRALLRCPIQVQQISVVISHSQTGSSEFGIFGVTELVASKVLIVSARGGFRFFSGRGELKLNYWSEIIRPHLTSFQTIWFDVGFAGRGKS